MYVGLATVLLTGTVLSGGNAYAQAVLPGAADVHVMMFPAKMFRGWPGRQGYEDHVTFTYATAVGETKALADSVKYSKLTARTLHDVQITTEATQLTGLRVPPMTCVTFTSPALLPAQSGGFDLEPLICSLKNYKRLRLSFIVDPAFRFTGLRTYNDRYVNIRLDEMSTSASAMYTYDVAIKDASFGQLTLPKWQADPAEQKRAEDFSARRKKSLLKVIGVVFVGCLAAFAGYVVYTVLSVKPPAG